MIQKRLLVHLLMEILGNLIKNNDLSINLKDVCNSKFHFIKESTNYIDFSSFHDEDILIIPVLNDKFQLVELIDLTFSKSKIPVTCVLMAGGRGKRLSPFTDKIPKPLLMLGDKPIIEHNIDRLVSFGVKNFIISIGYLGHMIKEYFGDGSKKNISIKYIEEEFPLGTAGSLSLLKNINNNPVLLMNSDLFTNFDLNKMYTTFINNSMDMVIASNTHKVNIPYAVFETNEEKKISGLVEKPNYNFNINAGIYLFKSKLIFKIPKNTYYDITDLIDLLIKENHNICHEQINGYWIDIGRPSDYKYVQDFIKSKTSN